MKNLRTIIALFALGLTTTLCAQENTEEVTPMVTDRPDATESPLTVPKGTIQIETGGFYTSFEETVLNTEVKQEVLGYNTTLLRLGLFSNLELRLGWNFEEGRTSINGNQLSDVSSGLSPLLAGMKINFTKEEGWVPTIGLLTHLYLPATAAEDYKTNTAGYDFRFSFAHSLSDRSSLSYNLGAQWDENAQMAYIYTLSYGFAFTDKFGAYAELYGDLPKGLNPNHLWDAGITYLVCHNLQLDATVGTSITDGQDLLLSAGVSYRIPK